MTPILATLRREFPGYRIWLDPTHSRDRFVARRQHPGPGPHTVVTSDPAELRTALAPSGPPEPGPPALPPEPGPPALPHPGAVPDTPKDTETDDPDEPPAARSKPA
jgi:hypothetical protein